MKLNVVDLFCGCGGLSEGFEDTGFNIIVGNDVEADMIESYKLNHPNSKAIAGDINNISSTQLLDGTGLQKEEISLVIGGPPCQGFSTVGDRREDDPRNKLFYQFLRIVEEINPKAFVMENVTGLLTMQNGRVKAVIKEEFEKLGYTVKYSILKAEDYGVPQKRRRVFFVGHKMNEIEFEFPKPTHGIVSDSGQSTLTSVTTNLKPFLTVWDAIGDLPSIECGESKDNYDKEPKNNIQKFLRNGETNLREHKAPNHTDIMIKRMENIKQGKNHSNLPKELQLSSGYPNIYGRLIANEPADTITGNCGCISAPGRFIHPFNHRALTVREAARLQSFRDSKKFEGSQMRKYKQVGNAVPPLLAKALASKVKELFIKVPLFA